MISPGRNNYVNILLILIIVSACFSILPGCEIVESEKSSQGLISVTAFDTTLNENLSDAEILIDGILRQEKTPAQIAGIKEGEHSITLRPPYLDYPIVETHFRFSPPETLDVSLTVGRSLQPGLLYIETNNDPARVYVNQNFNFQNTPVVLSLAPGEHQLAAFRSGCLSDAPSISLVQIRADDSLSVLLKLKQANTGTSPGDLAPDVCLFSDLGDSCSIAQYRGCVLLVNFAGFSCDPCIGELPQIQNVYDEYFNDGFRVLVINVGWWNEGPEEFEIVRNELGISMPLMYPDANGINAPNLYEVIAAPTNILVDRSGIIRQRFGVTTYEDLKSRVESMI
ncbi:MAG: TlpA disulfide reductase family protein [Candidatus Electryonea clarkiae]|nr:TlpA disulfide reductase family protein [Candidatus Electryonea clarkiae]MDP8286237.1 TlpA disulfide reductase family protein [Candidatus Electryonea clarkiae]